MKRVFNYGLLVAIISLGAGLRFWHLDWKAFWQDEIVTALFSLGRTYQDVVLDQVVPLSQFMEIFTQKPGITCSQITEALATQSTHPPLFFCLAYQWLALPWGSEVSLVWELRAFAALWGVAAIGAMYGLARAAFSSTVGLIGAGLMAVSPFAVYLSQEARHYTLPLFLVCLALWGLVEMQRDLDQHRSVRWWVLLGWMSANVAGFYTHYFFLLAFVGQLLALMTLGVWRLSWRHLWSLVGGILVTLGLMWPGLAIFLSYGSRPETEWLQLSSPVAPIYQTLLGWLILLITLPVEKQPLLIKIISLALTLIFLIGFVRAIIPGTRRLWRTQETHRNTSLLLSFCGWIALEFLAIIYLGGKDLTLAPRYNYVYYPAICTLLAGSLWMLKKYAKAITLVSVFSVGILSSIFVVTDLTFKKPFHPQKIISDILPPDAAPLVVAVGYNDLQDVALGLSLGLELGNHPDRMTSSSLVFLQREQTAEANPILGYRPVWEAISQLQSLPQPPLHLWVVAPGLKAPDFPATLQLRSQSKPPTQCYLETRPPQNVGVTYQHYPCLPLTRSQKNP